jgi:anaerobic magnesium-protoporphyrin IX monomethyl ester cyclase
MMNVLLIYPNGMNETGYKPIGISMLSAVLKKAGHDVKLFDTTFYDMGGTSVHSIGAGILNFKNVKFPEEVYEQKKTLKEDLLKLIDDFKPGLIGFSVLSTMISTSKKLATMIKEVYPNIPIIVGGKHATVAPEETISYKDFDLLCVGEGEEALVELANNPERTDIKNIWFKKEGEIIRNPVRPLIADLDSLPYPDLSIWDKRQFLKPFRGKVRVGLDYESGRGCVYQCNYCINKYLHELYGMKGFYRQKSPRRIVDEIKYLHETYGIEFIKFFDEDFLMRSTETVKEISNLYKKEVGIPFAIEINANSTTTEKAMLLKEMNCVSASIGLESGNEAYRETVLNRRVSDKSIIAACKSLKKAGIQTVSFNMLGTPFHTRGLIMESVELNKKAGFNIASAGLFYPYKGSPIRQVCIDYGFINPDDEHEVNTRAETIMNMWSIKPEELKGLLRTFVMYIKSPKIMYPLIRWSEKDKPINNLWFKILRNIYYFKIHLIGL